MLKSRGKQGSTIQEISVMTVSRNKQLILISAVVVLTQLTACSAEEAASSTASSTSSSSSSSSADTSCKLKETQVHLSTAIEFANKVSASLKDLESTGCPPEPEDCSVLFNRGTTSSGVYILWPKSRILENSIRAYCDMETGGGGWTVIQRRGNFGRRKDYFYQGWSAYKQGFGNPSEDFWIGNDLLFALTNQKKYSIRVDLKDGENNERWAQYDNFWIDSEECNYTLHVSGFRGNAGDSFSYHSGSQFTTKDRDNDEHATVNCAVSYQGAWWYKTCHSSNLNGLYLNGYHQDQVAKGVNWNAWYYYNYSYPFAEMKIRPISFGIGHSQPQTIIPH